MKKLSGINLVLVSVALSPLAYLAVRWRSIPANFVLRADFGQLLETTESRMALVVTSLVLAAAAIGIYWMMRNLQGLDPKVTEETPKSAFNRLGFVVALFLTSLNYLFILTAENTWTVNANVAFGLYGALVAMLGNYFYSLRPNHFAGIRLKWTLRDPENWRKTHQFTGKLWVASGIAMILISLAVPATWAVVAISSIIIVLVPNAYSHRLHRSKGTL